MSETFPNEHHDMQFCFCMAELTNKKKRELAKELFIRTNLNQKEIAEKVGVTEKTMSGWVNDPRENWEQLRVTVITTKESELRRLYGQLKELNDWIGMREIGKRYPSPAEADTISKLSSAIEKLETETNAGQVIDVFMEFNDFIRASGNLEYAQELGEWQDKYIRTLL